MLHASESKQVTVTSTVYYYYYCCCCCINTLNVAHSVVLLYLPVGGVYVNLCASCAVGKLEQAGKHAMVFWRVREDGVLEVDSVWNDAVVFIHPEKKCKRNYITMINNCHAWNNI